MTLRRFAPFGLASLVGLLAVTAVGAQTRPAPPAVTGGNGLMYIGTYKGEIQIFDEATEKQVGAIALKTGIPRSLVPSQDRQRFYVLDATLEKVEIVDIASRATLDQFTLSSGDTRTRVRSMAPDPLNRFVILLTRSATKKTDRWEIGPSTLQLYDFAQKKVTRTIDWPQGEERESADLRFSPDGKLLYFFGDDVLIYETTGFTKVDEWALSQPQEPGLGRVTLGAIDDLYDQPGYFTGLFTMQDPVQNRRLMGIGRVDLNAKRVDWTPLGPAQPLTFAQSPDRKRGHAIFQDIQRYEFWTFDLEQKRVLNRAEFKGRPRLDLRVSSNGKLLYVFVAGATIDIYDAATYKLLRTIQMNADQTTDLFVFPAPAGRPASTGARH
jgi:hypothetical protein